MPNKNSGTERPYAPLLEPFKRIDIKYKAVSTLITVFTQFCTKQLYKQLLSNERMLVLLGR